MRRLVAMLVLVGCSFGAGRVSAPHASRRLQEDDPGWDCRTMGNRVCGPGAADVTGTNR